ncbi:MAG: beta-propeller domain-containing protein [Polyangiaceae bacterium]
MLSRKTTFWRWSLAGVAAVLGAATAGCGTTPTQPPGGGDEFISDSPYGNYGGVNDAAGEGAGGGSGDTSTTTDDNGDGEKAIQEADVIQVDGDLLFALSQYGGLSVVDISDPQNLTIVGRYAVEGVPFEMYLQDGVVYAMFSSFGSWECDAGYNNCEYITSSHIEALDVSNPASIEQIGSFDLPGEISDSRIVGDVLYAVSYENGYCWGCSDKPTTTVTSIDVGDPADIGVVDSVAFDSPDPYGYGWGKRSVTVTQDRMFIAGIEWNGGSEGHSTIQVVDISAPDGTLHVGAAVQAAGMIESRWQMDEHDGVLRVISQPGVWWTNGVPQVQTFQISSSDSVIPLATLDMVLPMPERLRSARFDGTRLYAITAEQTDPLFTLDLSNPSQPLQVGELEIPGWVYHLEPRGDRVFALGFDPANPEGSMNVSLFDVSDYAAPALVKRVAFGGDWSWAPEDQDRIHKAFKIDQDLGAIFVPYGAYSYEETESYYGCGHVDSGIQIIDFTMDSLTKRGSAPLHGFARRALIHDGKLFSISDSEVGAYDIADRDAPQQLDTVALSNWVNQSVRVGNKVVRIASDWWTNAAALDVVPANDAERAEPLGSLDLKELVSDGDSSCYGWGYFYGAQLFPVGADRVALVWSSYDYWYEDGSGKNPGGTHVVLVSVANPADPQVLGHLELPFRTDMYGWYGSLDGGKAVVQIGNRLVLRHLERPAYDSDELEKAWLETIDVSALGDPVHVASTQLPSGFGHSLLVQNGIEVLTSHWSPVLAQPGKVKFYLDRLTITQAAPPGSVTSTNVPGALLAYDAQSSHALTMDFQNKVAIGVSAQDCYTQYGWYSWVDGDGSSQVCHYMEQSLKLIELDANSNVEVLDTEVLDTGLYFYGTISTESRVFAEGYSYSYEDGYGYQTLFAVGDIDGDSIHSATYEVNPGLYVSPLAADGERLVLGSWSSPGLHVLDTSDMSDMTLEKKGNLRGYVYSARIEGDTALCALGPWGLQSVDLQ